jgi:hypothetical protein
MYGFLADVTIAVHVVYVAFVVAGELLILLGGWRGWAWVRHSWFRTAHRTRDVPVLPARPAGGDGGTI